MTEKAEIKLAVHAIRSFAQEHYGWSAKYHPEDKEKWLALMNVATTLENISTRKAPLNELQSML